LGLTVFFLPSCTKQHSLKKKEQLQLHEARLFDVPFYIGAFNTITKNYQDGTEQIEYAVHATREQIYTFFSDEMERFGWQNEIEFGSADQVLIFKKPTSYVFIRLQELRMQTVQVTILLKRSTIASTKSFDGCDE
jgi:hypothetical protein